MYNLVVARFADRVYEVVRHVPKGRVTTYKAVAEALGTKAYRAVGTALKNNPFAPEVPCHRVIKTNGEIGGFMGGKGWESRNKKRKILEREGVLFNEWKVKGFEETLFEF